jgi:pyruvate dehydrogenase E1 component
MVTIMTSLWLEQLGSDDRVSVKPHASPVLHALEYLLGDLDAAYLTSLRQFGGLQSYPSRLKDPVPADYSTGSVGIGATAPIWGALARRYVAGHFGAGGTGRQWSLVGDAELDEGAVWEAVLDPMVAELGEVVWVVDLNRQSLDRVVPTMGATRCRACSARPAGRCSRSSTGGCWRSCSPGRTARAAGPDRRHVQRRIPAAAAPGAGRAATALPGDGPPRPPSPS